MTTLKDATVPSPSGEANLRMRFLIQDATGKNLVDPVEVAIPTVLPLKIAKLYLPVVALKAIKEKLADALKAMGFK